MHDETDLERALRLDPDVIGINNRNLSDLSVDTGTTPELITDVPAGITVVAESGYDDPAQVEELERIGVDALLFRLEPCSIDCISGRLRFVLISLKE